VAGLILASVPVNSEAGSYLTFGGPVGLFVVVAAILYLLFSRPHRRVPPRRALAPSRAGGSGQAGNVSGTTTASSEAPSAGATATDETPGPDTTKGPDKSTEASE
jgi:hypothetical protein